MEGLGRAVLRILPPILVMAAWNLISDLRIMGLGIMEVCEGLLVLAVFLPVGNHAIGGYRKALTLGFLAMALVVLAGYVQNAQAAQAQLAFVASRGLSTTLLYEKLSFYGLLTLLACFSAFSFGDILARNLRRVAWFMDMFIVVGTCIGAVNLVYWFLETGGVVDRYNYMPVFSDSQGATQFRMWFLLIFALVRLFQEDHRSTRRHLYHTAVILAALNIATIAVRLGWIQIGLSVLVFLWSLRKSFPARVQRRVPMAIAVGTLLVGTLVARKFGQEYAAILNPWSESGPGLGGDTSLLDRLYLLDRAWQLFLGNLALGVGYGHFLLYSTVPTIVSGQEVYVSSAHNGIFMMLAETGLAGTLVFLVLNGILLASLKAQLGRVKGREGYVLLRGGVVILLVAVLGQMLGNSDLVPIPTEPTCIQQGLLLWILVGVCGGIAGQAPEASVAEAHG